MITKLVDALPAAAARRRLGEWEAPGVGWQGSHVKKQQCAGCKREVIKIQQGGALTCALVTSSAAGRCQPRNKLSGSPASRMPGGDWHMEAREALYALVFDASGESAATGRDSYRARDDQQRRHMRLDAQGVQRNGLGQLDEVPRVLGSVELWLGQQLPAALEQSGKARRKHRAHRHTPRQCSWQRLHSRVSP